MIAQPALGQKLVRVQAEHMRYEINKIYTPEGAGQSLASPIKREGTTFGYLLELRRRGLLADGREVKATSDELRDMVATGIGLIPVPGFDFVGKKVGSAFEWAGKRAGKAFDGINLQAYGEELGKDVHKDAGGFFDRSAEWVTEQFGESKTLDESYLTAANDWELVHNLMTEMIATDLLVHGELDHVELPEDATFIVNGKVKPLRKMKPHEYGGFLLWATERTDLSDFLGRVDDKMGNSINAVTRALGSE